MASEPSAIDALKTERRDGCRELFFLMDLSLQVSYALIRLPSDSVQNSKRFPIY
jgi:hypothetical protein